MRLSVCVCVCVVCGRTIGKRKRRTWNGGGVERRAGSGTATGAGAPGTAASAPGCVDGTVVANVDEEARVAVAAAGAKVGAVAMAPALALP